jgi:hypothetical protein
MNFTMAVTYYRVHSLGETCIVWVCNFTSGYQATRMI